MIRVLFDPTAISKQGNALAGDTIGAGPSIVDWATSSSSRAGTFVGPSGVADVDPVTRAAKVPHAGEFTPRQPSGLSFYDRVMSIARWPDSKNVEDRRGVDIRKDYTIDEWLKLPRNKPM